MSNARYIVLADPERFWSKVERGGPDECWEWTGSRNPLGYGSFHADSRAGGTWKAHRVAWMLAAGVDSLTAAEHICHRCDNPPCCNPAHLYRGNYKTNAADKVARGRQQRGESHANAIRASIPRGDDHWTHRTPERMNLSGFWPGWNKGLRDLRPHGTPNRYAQGCRCDECRAANTVYKRELRCRSQNS